VAGGGLTIKTTEIKIHWPRCLYLSQKKEQERKKGGRQQIVALAGIYRGIEDGTNSNDIKIA
jgi:hypothetical protein